LIARLKSHGIRMLVTATTGIAATLLFEGATMHSHIRIPLDVNESTVPPIDYESHVAAILRCLEVLIIDEVSAAHVNVIKYIDRALRQCDQERKHLPFGGKVNYSFYNYYFYQHDYRSSYLAVIGNNCCLSWNPLT
jgi:hypothetical protein